MIEEKDTGIKIYLDKIPLIREVLSFARMGIVPAGTYRNRDFRTQYLIGADKIERALMDILFDPQTSGGLLIAVKKEEAEGLLSRLHDKGEKEASLIGEFTGEHKGKIDLS